MKRSSHRDLVALLLCLGVLSLLPAVIDTRRMPYLFDVLFSVNVAVLLASSWNILGGFAGQVSFGHAGFAGIGAYAVALLPHHLQWSPWLSLPFAGIAAMIAAILVGGIAFRLRGPYFALSTLALAEVARLVVEGWRSFTEGTQGVVIQQKPLYLFEADGALFYITSLWLAGIALLAVITIGQSKSRYFLHAVGESEEAASALGVDAWRCKMSALLPSAFLAGMAGGILALHTGFLDPESAFSISRSVEPIILTVVGGIGTALGPVVGAVILVPACEFLRSRFPTGHLLLYGVLLVVFMRFMHGGILGMVRRKRL